MARHLLHAARVCAPGLPAKTDSMRLTVGLPYPSALGLPAKADSMRADRGTGAQVRVAVGGQSKRTAEAEGRENLDWEETLVRATGTWSHARAHVFGHAICR